MNIDIEIDKKTLSDVLKKFEFAQFAATKYFAEAMNESLMFTEANILLRTPTGATGDLKASISSQLISDMFRNIVGLVHTPKVYAVAVEKGSKPHFPPIEALTGKMESLDMWARLKGISAFAVAKGIAKKGTKKKEMFKKGLDASRQSVFAIFTAKAQQYIQSLRG